MRPYRIGTWGLRLLVAVGMLGMPGGAWGQTLPELLARVREVQLVAPSSTPRTFGTAGSTAYLIGASEFEPSRSNAASPAQWQYTPSYNKWSTRPLYAWVRLPAGAVVNAVELEGCDVTDTDFLYFQMFRQQASAGAFPLTDVGTSGMLQVPGCGVFTVLPLPTVRPLVIDNENNTYLVSVFAGTDFTTFSAVRIYYTLQVSPAPAVASFGDVPTTHPFFPFIEALKASGITGGCQASPPLFCPDAPLTRGQMATFLSLALGLHFAP